MIRTASLLTALALAGAAPLAAQQVLQPRTAAADPVRDTIRRDLLTVRDSASRVDAAIARLPIELRNTSAAVLESRARQLAAACAATGRTVPGVRAHLAAAAVPAAQARAWRDSVLASLDRLGPVLSECDRTFAAMGVSGKGEEVRGYGWSRSRPVDRALRSYERAALRLAAALQIDYTPRPAAPARSR